MFYNQPLPYNVSQKDVLAPSIRAVWDAMCIGVAVVDAEGVCRYMNPIQQRVDGFGTLRVVGTHITKLYVPNDFKCIPTIECLQTGKPLLRKAYWYKTINDYSASTVTDFLPLFDKGMRDGVIAFTIWRNDTELMRNAGRKKGGGETGAPRLYSFDDLVGRDDEVVRVVSEARKAAKTSSPVMIWGESGTGKEVFAQAIHSASERRHGHFVPVNCAAIPENLLEGILFGTTKGAYTDASDRAGLFEEANGGTLLLDELNSMPPGLQAKLLRVLQEKRVRRLGSFTEIPVDVRIISVLNQPPLAAVESGVLRQDLFYRLAVVSIAVPPLRRRKSDIPLLVRNFIGQAEALTPPHNPILLSEDVLDMFQLYDWPGNIRELAHVLEGSLALLGEGTVITPECLPAHFRTAFQNARLEAEGLPAPVSDAEGLPALTSDAEGLPAPTPDTGGGLPAGAYFDYRRIRRGEAVSLKSCMNKYEIRCISNVLRVTGGNVAKAARMLEMTPAGLRYRIKTLNIDENSY